MKSFTVHEKPSAPAERIDRAELLVFIKDGFNVFAGFLTPIWMVVNRLWIELFAYLALAALLVLVFDGLGVAASIRSTLLLGCNLLIGFEADSIRRWSLERRGWRLIGSVTGENGDVCERRFFENWLPTTAAVNVDTLGGAFGDPRSDPFAAATRVPKASNLGVVREARRGGIVGNWRSRS